MVSYLDKCIDNAGSRRVLNKIYFDFAKAFYSVPHKRLLGKLKSCGINGKVLEWTKAI